MPCKQALCDGLCAETRNSKSGALSLASSCLSGVRGSSSSGVFCWARGSPLGSMILRRFSGSNKARIAVWVLLGACVFFFSNSALEFKGGPGKCSLGRSHSAATAITQTHTKQQTHRTYNTHGGSKSTKKLKEKSWGSCSVQCGGSLLQMQMQLGRLRFLSHPARVA